MNSVHQEHFYTMNPDSRFMSPRPAPAPPQPLARVLSSAPATKLRKKRSARSLSPGPAGWSFPNRKLFSKKTSSSSLRDVSFLKEASSVTASSLRDVHTPTPEEAVGPFSTTRHDVLTSEPMRRFLAEDLLPQEAVTTGPSFTIPEDMSDFEDDENFATSAFYDVAPFTVLSPPPSTRSYSPSPSPSTIVPEAMRPPAMAAPIRQPPSVPHLPTLAPQHKSHFSIDSSCFSPASPSCPASPSSPNSSSPPPFFHSDDDDDDDKDSFPSPSINADSFPSPPAHSVQEKEVVAPRPRGLGHRLTASLSTYSLPPSSSEGSKTQQPAPLRSTGLDDFVNELGWMADVIRGNFV